MYSGTLGQAWLAVGVALLGFSVPARAMKLMKPETQKKKGAYCFGCNVGKEFQRTEKKLMEELGLHVLETTGGKNSTAKLNENLVREFFDTVLKVKHYPLTDRDLKYVSLFGGAYNVVGDRHEFKTDHLPALKDPYKKLLTTVNEVDDSKREKSVHPLLDSYAAATAPTEEELKNIDVEILTRRLGLLFAARDGFARDDQITEALKKADIKPPSTNDTTISGGKGAPAKPYFIRLNYTPANKDEPHTVATVSPMAVPNANYLGNLDRLIKAKTILPMIDHYTDKYARDRGWYSSW